MCQLPLSSVRHQISRVLPTSALVVLLLLVPATAAQAQTAHRDGDGNITMGMVGDMIITRSLSVYDEPEFLMLRDLLREQTVAFGNMEMLLHDYGPDIVPAAETGSTYMAGHPDLAQELAWMGFDMLSGANNHAMDYGAGGMRSTRRALEAAGIKYAGVGENLALARAPAYLETRDGRVALISVSSTFADHMRAGHQRPDIGGRPGLAPMRLETTHIVPREAYEQLEEVREQVGGIDAEFQPGDRYETITTPHQGDLEGLLATVRDAKRQANWVVVTSHTHDGKGSDLWTPADALVTFARAAIEAGADAFYGHGPHVLRGIEIHQGKPIFYSLDDFVFQNETPPFQPYDNYEREGLGFEALPSDFYDTREANSGGGRPAEAFWWDGAVALTEFRGGELYRIRLVPTMLGYGLDRPQRGRPMAATGADVQRILELLQALSEPFGTRIEIVNGEGIILGPAAVQDGGALGGG